MESYNKIDEMFTELTRKAQETNPKVTQKMVESWVGNAGYVEIQCKWMTIVLEELATGEYTAYDLAEEILSYNEMKGEEAASLC